MKTTSGRQWRCSEDGKVVRFKKRRHSSLKIVQSVSKVLHAHILLLHTIILLGSWVIYTF